jgi:hypothetical protein
VDSSAAGADHSSATAAVGSSPSQVKSVDFLQSTQPVVNPVRLPNQMYYSGKDHHLQARPDHCHGWGAEDAGDVDQHSLSGRLLLGLRSRLLFSDSSGWFSAPLSNWGWHVSCATSSSTVGLGCGYLRPALPLYPSRLRPPALRGRKAESPASNGVSSLAYATSRHKYPTTLLKEAYLL